MGLLAAHPIKTVIGVVNEAVRLSNICLTREVGFHEIGDFKGAVIAHGQRRSLNLFYWTPCTDIC
jgi:hypothetical protein